MKVKYWAALAAVFAVAAGSATAGPTVKKLITGQDIKDGSIGLVDLSSTTKTSLKGQRGSAGSQGPAGAKGDTGPAGPAGPQGAKGDTGATGATGAQGVQGPKGDTGPVGKGLTWRGTWSSATSYVVGDAVREGSSAYVATQPSTNVDPAATPASWDVLFTGVGPQGAAGPAGPAGAAGAQGALGPQGPQGLKGDTGSQGPKGADGAAGPPGVSGYDYEPVTLYADPNTKLQPHISSTDPHVDTASCAGGRSVLSGGVIPVTVGYGDPPTSSSDAPPGAIQVFWSAPISPSTWAVSWAFNGGTDWVTAELRLVCVTAN